MSPAPDTPVVVPVSPAADAPGPPTRVETLLARVMFVLAAVHLLLIAGLIHRAPSKQVTPVELAVLYAGLAALWPVFIGEAIIGVLRRDRSKPLRPVLLRAVLVSLMPPFRMGLTDPRVGKIWLPRLGWQERGKDLYKRLDRAFSGPMILFALLILPVLGLEYLQAERVKSTPGLALALDLGIAVIWIAFATEFILDVSAAPSPLTHAKEKWLDVAIVVLPMLEFVLTKVVDAAPLARLLRLGRAISPEQIARMQQLYRLRGLMTKAWQAFLILGGMSRLLGNVDEKRLRTVEGQITTLEEELAALRKEADELRAKIAVKAGTEAPQG
jgi:voltage-gated potassium channel